MRFPIKLGIDNPCNESWEKMTPSDGGNYCNSCKKTVVDFTGMSDKEVYEFMQRASASVCGRVNTDQLSKVLTPAASAIPVAYRKSVWRLLVAGFVCHRGEEPAEVTRNDSLCYYRAKFAGA